MPRKVPHMPDDSDVDELLTQKEAIEESGLAEWTFIKRLEAGLLRRYRRRGGRIHYSRQEVLNLKLKKS